MVKEWEGQGSRRGKVRDMGKGGGRGFATGVRQHNGVRKEKEGRR